MIERVLKEEVGCAGKVPAHKKETVVIIDAGGKLKLARWRLHSDGYRVVYLGQVLDWQVLNREQPDLVLLNVMDPIEGMELFASLLEKFPALRIMLVIGSGMDHVIRTARNMGAAGFINRPVDFLALSTSVKELLKAQPAVTKEEKPTGLPSRCFRLGQFRSDSVWKSIMDTVRSGIIMVNPAGEIEYANAAIVEWLQSNLSGSRKSYRETLGRSEHPLGRQLAIIITRALEEQELVHEKEYINYKISSYLLYNSKKQPNGAFVIVEGIVRPERSGPDMVQTEKLAIVGQLAAGAAHEIRNPLTSVRGFIQLLQKELSGSPKAEYIDIIIAEIDRVNAIINEFLKLAKPATPRRISCPLKDLFNEIRVLVESEAFIKNVDVTEEIDDLPEIMIDKEQVKQVLINIIQNSFDAMPHGGKLAIRVGAEPGEEAIRISVQDSGCGMDPEIVEKIFKPFYTTKESGTGLGLSVSLQIIENHGGRIEVDSAPGRGTTINIYLPY